MNTATRLMQSLHLGKQRQAKRRRLTFHHHTRFSLNGWPVTQKIFQQIPDQGQNQPASCCFVLDPVHGVIMKLFQAAAAVLTVAVVNVVAAAAALDSIRFLRLLLNVAGPNLLLLLPIAHLCGLHFVWMDRASWWNPTQMDPTYTHTHKSL